MRGRLLVVFFVLWAGPLHASKPSVNSIDYATPSKYLEIVDSLGTQAKINRHVAELKGDSDLATIRNVLRWMDRHLKYDGKIAYKWRNYDDLMREKAYGGCADQGVFCGVLLKAAGIPVVWVKTMDVPWIWNFKKGRPFQSWSGHVFLEVYVDGKWELLDPGGKVIYENYSPKMRILPGNRFAYHKGDDPKQMIMSLQWEPWKEQTRKYFRGLDESLLPVDSEDKTYLARQAYVVGNSPYYQRMTKMAQRKGLRVAKSFNCGYDVWLPKARGHVLLIETHKGVPIVSLKVLEKYFPKAAGGLKNDNGIVEIGGTTIVFLDFSRPLRVLPIGEEERSR